MTFTVSSRLMEIKWPSWTTKPNKVNCMPRLGAYTKDTGLMASTGEFGVSSIQSVPANNLTISVRGIKVIRARVVSNSLNSDTVTLFLVRRKIPPLFGIP